MSDPSNGDRLRQLEEKLATLRKTEAARTGSGKRDGQIDRANLAWQMVTELVAGLVIGIGIGYGLDALFATRPWFMVLFTLLGFTAGVRVMLRTAGEVSKKREAGPATTDNDGRDSVQSNEDR